MPILAQLQLINKPIVRLHVRFAYRYQAHARLFEQARFIIGAVKGFVAKQPCARRQHVSQFMQWRQIVERRRQQAKTDRDTLWSTEQMQPKAEELLLFGRTVATIFPAADFATAPGANASTDRQWDAV